jgi:hypothetical protein
MGAALKAEYIGQDRDGGGLDDKGWYAQATYRLLPWVQVVLKQEDFRRSAVSDALRNRATTGGLNVEFAAAKVRLLGRLCLAQDRNAGHSPRNAHLGRRSSSNPRLAAVPRERLPTG